MNDLNSSFIQDCKERLLYLKMDLLNQFKSTKNQLSLQEFRGDEIDLSASIMAENGLLASQNRIRQQILEIELALARIDSGSFGTCEETDEPIEVERLKAIPWTRLSIEGAEIREALSSRRAR